MYLQINIHTMARHKTLSLMTAMQKQKISRILVGRYPFLCLVASWWPWNNAFKDVLFRCSWSVTLGWFKCMKTFFFFFYFKQKVHENARKAFVMYLSFSFSGAKSTHVCSRKWANTIQNSICVWFINEVGFEIKMDSNENCDDYISWCFFSCLEWDLNIKSVPEMDFGGLEHFYFSWNQNENETFCNQLVGMGVTHSCSRAQLCIAKLAIRFNNR